MALLALHDPDARLTVQAGGLVVVREGKEVASVPLRDVDEVHLHGRADLSAAARDLCLREGIPVVFFTADGRYKGRLVGPLDRQGQRRLAQVRHLLDPGRRLDLARWIIKGKLTNQRAALLERNRRHQDEGVADTLAALRALIPRVEQAESLDALRGLEGLGARHHFAGVASALRNELFPFDGRNRHPPRDPVNACLSYGYALLTARVEHAVLGAGLDPFVGALHDVGRGAPCLVLDLVEEWRPLVDGVVLTLLNRRQLTPEDFRMPDLAELGARAELEGAEEAVYLGPVARNALLHAVERALDQTSTHPVRGDTWVRRTLFREQALQVARLFEGTTPAYRPVTL
jgi:CRISPR-associated protein Cas1